MKRFFLDLQYAVRVLGKSPGFAVVALLTLALGTGANTAIFQLLNSVRMQMLPVKNPQELVEISLANHKGVRGTRQSWKLGLTNPLWEEVRNHQQAFAGMFAWAAEDFNLAPSGEVRYAHGLWVSGDFFHVLSVQPVLGRLFTTADDNRGCGLPGAVISYPFWQREFGGDAAVIGKKLTLNRDPVEIIGVTPASFFGLEVGHSFDVALPICSQATLGGGYSYLDAGTVWWLNVMGRLKPGSTPEMANAQLMASSPGIFQTTLPKNYPATNVQDYLKFKLVTHPAATGISELREQYQTSLWLLLGIAGAVLLIASANLANLLLARATAREREIATRLALGASPGQVARQLITESLLLAVAGTGLGLALAGTLSRFMVSLLSTQGNSLFLDLHLDWRVFGFTSGLAILTCLLCGLAPAWRASRVAPVEATKSGGRGLTSSTDRLRLRRVLVTIQVALSLVLLTTAVLFSTSFRNVLTVNPGFTSKGILITDVDMMRIAKERRVSYHNELMSKVRSVPGVASAAEIGFIPLTGPGGENDVWMDGRDPATRKPVNFSEISKDYFKTLEIPLLAGRDFNDHDTLTTPQVAIVNRAFARSLGLEGNLVGQHFRRESTPSEPEMVFDIVGVVGDTKYRDIHADFLPIAFLASSQDSRPPWYAQIMVRSDIPMADLTSRLKYEIAALDPNVSIEFQVFDTAIRDGLLQERLLATLSNFFGLLAALLVSLGVYGVMSYMVLQRTNEIGIRLALGADRGTIMSLIFREAGKLLVVGLIVGALLSLTITKATSSLLFGVKAGNPFILAAVIVGLSLIVACASFLPTRRASRLDPMVALRYE